jgi:hypothetical protein
VVNGLAHAFEIDQHCGRPATGVSRAERARRASDRAADSRLELIPAARHGARFGNGRNDGMMLDAASFGVGVVGGDGIAMQALVAADACRSSHWRRVRIAARAASPDASLRA